MGDLIKIGDVAEIFDIPTSTLRFWERSGLISFERDDVNNYRRFPFQTLVEIADITFARDVGTPLAQYKDIRLSDMDEQKDLLDGFEVDARRRIAAIEHSISKIHARKELIELWESVRAESIHLERAKLEPVYRFDFSDKDMVKLYLEKPIDAVDIISSTVPESYEYGRFMRASDRELIREGDDADCEYLCGPLWMNERRQTNVEEFWAKAKSLGKKPGKAICRYLISGMEETQGYCYFFKAWLEVF